MRHGPSDANWAASHDIPTTPVAPRVGGYQHPFPRTAEEVARRGVVLGGVGAALDGCPAATVIDWLTNQGLRDEISPLEWAYLSNPAAITPTARAALHIRRESLPVLLWALGRWGALGRPTGCSDPAVLAYKIPSPGQSVAPFFEKVELRSPSELIAEVNRHGDLFDTMIDPASFVNTACPFDIDFGVLIARKAAFDWLSAPRDWDHAEPEAFVTGDLEDAKTRQTTTQRLIDQADGAIVCIPYATASIACSVDHTYLNSRPNRARTGDAGPLPDVGHQWPTSGPYRGPRRPEGLNVPEIESAGPQRPRPSRRITRPLARRSMAQADEGSPTRQHPPTQHTGTQRPESSPDGRSEEGVPSMSASPQSNPTGFPESHLAFVNFRERHPDWFGQFDPDEPIYCLPEKGVESAKGTSADKLIRFRQSEIAFTAWCRAHKVVGVHRNRVITFPLLQPRIPTPPESFFKANPGLQQVAHDFAKLNQGMNAIEDLILAAVGYLLTKHRFIEDRDTIRTAILRQRPAFCSRIRLLGQTAEFSDEPEGTDGIDAKTLDLCEAFLTNWQLRELTTWDLPYPNGPLIPDLRPPNALDARRRAVNVSIPTFWPLTKKSPDFLEEIRAAQRDEVTDRGLPSDFAGIPSPSQFRKMALVMHLEQAIRQRQRGDLPHGGVVVLCSLAEAEHGISEREVKGLRKDIEERQNRQLADTTYAECAQMSVRK